MAVTSNTRHERRRQIFSSIFPSSSVVHELPTPLATPQLGSNVEGEPIGVQPTPQKGRRSLALTVAEEQTRWNRAWHTATTFLLLPRQHIHADLHSADIRRTWLKRAPLETATALEVVVEPLVSAAAHSDRAPQGSILEWYLHEVRRHYLAYVRPLLSVENQVADPQTKLSQLFKVLQIAQLVYLHPVLDHIVPAMRKPKERYESLSSNSAFTSDIESTFRKDLRAILVFGLQIERIVGLFSEVLITECRIALSAGGSGGLGRSTRFDASDDAVMSDPDTQESLLGAHSEDSQELAAARNRICQMFKTFDDVGLGSERGQRVFADVMNQMISEHVKTTYTDRWEGPSQSVAELKDWTENRFARLVFEVLRSLNVHQQHTTQSSEDTADALGSLVGLEDVQKWQEMGVNRLGRLRVTQLFDIVVDWDASSGAIQDLKTFSITPANRTHLTSALISVLSRRLLHPGASTVEILQAYICLIRSFYALDPKGVLLDRVARPIRRYLREREDTVKVVVGGLLADAEEPDTAEEADSEVLRDLAQELNRASQLAAQAAHEDADLNWDDLEWVPDPIDAGPEYRRPQGSDVVGSLLSLFDSKDVFVKELQNMLGERLLRGNLDLEREVRLLELLKVRFGENALQACEVMVRDIRESRVIDRTIGREREVPEPFHSKIISYLFWPGLHEGTFEVPKDVEATQARYAQGFEALKRSRKLTWLQALGHVTVELELEDRVVEEEVHTWQASVIYAFQEGQKHTVEGLVETLHMDESLVRGALAFWTHKGVLKESEGVYEVVERAEDGAASAARPQFMAQESSTGFKSAEEVAREKMSMYWQFIVAMLTNGGPMPLVQISGMLKFTVAGGAGFTEEELRQYLQRMVAERKLEVVGERYKIVT